MPIKELRGLLCSTVSQSRDITTPFTRYSNKASAKYTVLLRDIGTIQQSKASAHTRDLLYTIVRPAK